MIYYGHSGQEPDQSDWQLLINHLEGVAKMASDFAEPFGGEKMAYLAGMLHDIGKYSPEFQRRLEGSPEKVDHTSAGAQEAVRMFGDRWGRMLAYLIVGHHGGIPDWEDASPSSVFARLKKTDLKDFSAWEHEVKTRIINLKPAAKIKSEKKIQFYQLANYIRMLYSCLVDADFMDTEKAFGSPNSESRGLTTPLPELLTILEEKLASVSSCANNTPINRHRKDILNQCIVAADSSQGMFTLTVPTGGGKTLSSMAFALKHALRHGMKRIIYVIPYTSIIEQNAKVFKDIFGEHNVLEHHSNYAFDDLADTGDEATDVRNLSIRLATQNWDAPIIVTTSVQFFESFFSNKPSKCRKLHNVSNSVVILDEAQMLPVELLKPSVALLGDLVMNYQTSVVLCTATQPSLNPYLPSTIKVKEIMDSPRELYEAFRRVRVELIGAEELKDTDLAEKIRQQSQVLSIVNTRNHAFRLYKELGECDGSFHLSARMCPLHRREKLSAIRQSLKDGLPCKVISTQLIEAGVDVDFPVVYRSMAGIDSIAQSAGRCNREGRLESGTVYAFMPEEHGIPKGYMGLTASKAREVFRHHSDPLSLSAVHSYFEALYHAQDSQLDRWGILQLHKDGGEEFQIPFAEIARKYQLIENGMKSLIIPYASEHSEHEAEELIQVMRYTKYPGSLLKRLQKYTVQVYPFEFKKLQDAGAVECIQEAFYVLTGLEFYSNEFGLQIPGQQQDTSQLYIF